MKKIDKKIYMYMVVIFCLFIIIGFLIPYTGDDWNNILHNGSLKNIIKLAVNNYNTFEGRFFSRISVLLLNYYKPIWVLLNGFGMTFLYYFIVKISGVKNKTFLLVLIIESLLLVDEETFSQIYVWITGNITYFVPMMYLIFLIFINKQIFDKERKIIKYNKFSYIFFPILSFIFSMFVENVSVGIISVCLLIIIYYFIKNKKINVFMVLNLLFSIIGLYLMLNSPGTANRINTMINFDNLNLLEKIIRTFPRQMNYVFIKNSFLLLLFSIITSVIIYRNYSNKKKIFLNLFMLIIPIITIINGVNFILRSESLKYLNVFLDCSNWYILLYWVSYLLLLIYLIVKHIKKDKAKLLFFFLIALINNASMLISPLAGGRTSYLSTIMLIICAIIILNNLDIKVLKNNGIIKTNKLAFTMLIFVIVSFYTYSYMLNEKREHYLYKQLKEDKNNIELIMLPGKYLWNANPWDEWHEYTFKEYYNIPENKNLIIKKKSECDL